MSQKPNLQFDSLIRSRSGLNLSRKNTKMNPLASTRRNIKLNTLSSKEPKTKISSKLYNSLSSDKITSPNISLSLSSLMSYTHAKDPESDSQRFRSDFIKLKHDLTSILHNITDDEIVPSLKRARTICKALEVFIKEDRYYQREFKIIICLAQKALFQDPGKICQQVLDYIYDNYTDCLLDNKDIPYFYITEAYAFLYNSANQEIEQLEFLLRKKEDGN